MQELGFVGMAWGWEGCLIYDGRYGHGKKGGISNRLPRLAAWLYDLTD
jgi:hypothetical protein